MSDDFPIRPPDVNPPPKPIGEQMADFVRTQFGKGYSEQSPVGSDGDGHFWLPGDPWPDVYDCSGLIVTTLRHFRFGAFSNGNADDQWKQHLGGIVKASEPLKPGDIGSFRGAENVPGYAGHTGMVLTYDIHTRLGTLGNAYDTARGVCEIAFNRDQETNLTNGLAVIGFFRPANRR